MKEVNDLSKEEKEVKKFLTQVESSRNLIGFLRIFIVLASVYVSEVKGFTFKGKLIMMAIDYIMFSIVLTIIHIGKFDNNKRRKDDVIKASIGACLLVIATILLRTVTFI